MRRTCGAHQTSSPLGFSRSVSLETPAVDERAPAGRAGSERHRRPRRRGLRRAARRDRVQLPLLAVAALLQRDQRGRAVAHRVHGLQRAGDPLLDGHGPAARGARQGDAPPLGPPARDLLARARPGTPAALLLRVRRVVHHPAVRRGDGRGGEQQLPGVRPAVPLLRAGHHPPRLLPLLPLREGGDGAGDDGPDRQPHRLRPVDHHGVCVHVHQAGGGAGAVAHPGVGAVPRAQPARDSRAQRHAFLRRRRLRLGQGGSRSAC